MHLYTVPILKREMYTSGLSIRVPERAKIVICSTFDILARKKKKI